MPLDKEGCGHMISLRDICSKHPRLATWLFLSVGMVVLLLVFSRNVDLRTSERVWLVVATVGLAGGCAWIIGLEQNAAL